MERKQITISNSLHQVQDFVIDEYDDHIVLASLISAESGIVEIPSLIDGKPVTEIFGDCFFNCTYIKQITIPNSIAVIGAQAFALCKGLTEMIIPDSVTEIGHHAFRDCRGLKKVVLPKNLKRIEQGLFSFCHLNDPEITLPEGLEVIESGAFWSAGSFDLVIPDSVKEVGVGAFNWGPHPITKLPEDKGWYLQWPYGEIVISSEAQGKITDLHYLEGNCMIHEVTFESEIKNFVYPADYMDGKISFADEKNQRGFQNDIKNFWKEEPDREAAYRIRDAWMLGLISAQ